jgi:hypothetical protein
MFDLQCITLQYKTPTLKITESCLFCQLLAIATPSPSPANLKERLENVGLLSSCGAWLLLVIPLSLTKRKIFSLNIPNH